MKQFFKFMFASCLGSALMMIITTLVLILIINMSSSSIEVKPKTVLYMKLDYTIPERTTDDNIASYLFNMKEDDMSGMNDIIANIDAAKDDPNISGIFLELTSIGTSTANIEELRNHLKSFKTSGKFVITYSEMMGQNAYYLATAGDEIFINPAGTLDIHGMASQVMFYKNLLDKLDIDVQIIKGPDNKYKSAVEPYYLDKMSDANREQLSQLLATIWSKITDDIHNDRDVSVERLNELADSLTLAFNAQAAVDEGLIDGLAYRDEIIARIKSLAGIKSSDDLNILTNSQYASVRPEPKQKKEFIAVIYANGQIVDGEGDDSTIGSITLSKAIREARQDDAVKAIVMRVNSPGGSALASDVIRREVELAKAAKPFIVSMGNYAASGGYMISTASDYIFADPTTITGSIGVYGVFPNAKKFLNETVGLTFDVVKTNQNSDYGSIAEPMTPYQLEVHQKHVSKIYDEFTSLVAHTRNMTQSRVDSIGQGRVWAGADAIKINLVDELGGIDQAISYAANKANLSAYSIKEYPEQKDLIETLFSDDQQEPYAKLMLKKKLGSNYIFIEAVENISKQNGVQAIMPFMIVE